MANAPNPWDSPVWPIQMVLPTATPEELYTEVGRALTTWGAVEHQLCMLFLSWFPENQSKYAAYKIFGSRDSTSLQLDLMRITGEAYFSGQKERWDYLDKVLDLVSKFLPRRNNIAHGMLAHYGGAARLHQPHYKIKHRDKASGKGGYELDAAHIAQYTVYFNHLGHEIATANELLSTPGPEPVEPTLHQTPLAQYVEPQRKRLCKKLTHK